MRKILLLFAMVGFTAFAQDTISVTYFTEDGVRYAHIVSEDTDSPCYDSREDVSTTVYEWSSDSGILTFNGNNYSADGAQYDSYNNQFLMSLNLLVIADDDGNAVSVPGNQDLFSFNCQPPSHYETMLSWFEDNGFTYDLTGNHYGDLHGNKIGFSINNGIPTRFTMYTTGRAGSPSSITVDYSTSDDLVEFLDDNFGGRQQLEVTDFVLIDWDTRWIKIRGDATSLDGEVLWLRYNSYTNSVGRRMAVNGIEYDSVTDTTTIRTSLALSYILTYQSIRKY